MPECKQIAKLLERLELDVPNSVAPLTILLQHQGCDAFDFYEESMDGESYVGIGATKTDIPVAFGVNQEGDLEIPEVGKRYSYSYEKKSFKLDLSALTRQIRMSLEFVIPELESQEDIFLNFAVDWQMFSVLDRKLNNKLEGENIADLKQEVRKIIKMISVLGKSVRVWETSPEYSRFIEEEYHYREKAGSYYKIIR